MGYIYLITNLINGRQYVGQTVQSDINSRWKQHKSVSPNSVGKYLLDAYRKYGIDNFKFQIICICFDSDIDELEKFYISKFNTLAPNGYNLKSGGKHRYLSKEERDKISKSLSNKPRKPHSEETKQKMRSRMLGSNNPNFGKKMSDEQRKAISITMKKMYKNTTKCSRSPTEKQLEALSKYRCSPKSKVGKYDMELNLIKEYSTIEEASKDSNIHRSVISKVCRNVPYQKTAGGFKWQYIE
jgi:group I intron endonuclease